MLDTLFHLILILPEQAIEALKSSNITVLFRISRSVGNQKTHFFLFYSSKG